MEQIMSGQINIGVVLIKDGSLWVAQGLEHDVTAQAYTPNEALAAFDKIIIGHMHLDVKEGKAPLSSVPRAPKKYWEMVEKGFRVNEMKPLQNDGIHAQRQVLALA